MFESDKSINQPL